MARRETPEPWKTLMERRGIGSLRHLAREAGVSNPAVTRLVHGDGVSQDETIRRVADALGLDLPTMYAHVGMESPEAEPYVPPAEANRLTARQRRAIDEMIRAIVAEREDDDAGTQDQQKPWTREAHAQHESADRAEDGSTPQRTGAPMTAADYYALAADDSPRSLDDEDAAADARGEGSQVGREDSE